MSEPIRIHVINVELTEERKNQVYRQVQPLLRLTTHHREASCDVVIRSIRRPLSGTTFCVMLRIQSPTQTFYSVGMAHHFVRAVSEAHDEMRRTMSRSYTPDTKTIEHLRKRVHDRYFVELFV